MLEMRLRPYIHTSDYSYLEKWIDSERVHALWCANLISYPMSETALRSLLEKDAQEWGGHAYVATEDSGIPIGFGVYSVNSQDNSAFLNFVILTPALRGKGYGSIGFVERSVEKDIFSYNNEKWGRCNMTMANSSYRENLVWIE